MNNPICPECKAELREPEEGWFENIAVEHYWCPECLRHWIHTEIEKNQIREWAKAWIEYWTDFMAFSDVICRNYNGDLEKERIARYQTVLDALDGKLAMPPPKTWLKWP
jgi:hypothetical protein